MPLVYMLAFIHKQLIMKRFLKFRFLIPSIVVCAVLVTLSCNESIKKSISGELERSLEKAFDNQPESAKASGYWWWLKNNVNKEAITRDLENFRTKGMGLVLLACTKRGSSPGYQG